jgi:CheY-like chemotaxis protein
MIETEENAQERQILIVDDSAYNLFVLEELIKSIFQDNDKIIIKTALNGQEALKEIMSSNNLTVDQGSKFSHAFLDLHMPVMDGF